MVEVLIQLIENFALVLVIVYIYSFLRRRNVSHSFLTHTILPGLIYGAMAVIAMQRSIEIVDGILMDARVIIIALSGFFGGPFTAIITGFIVAVHRAFIGGEGLVPGLVNILVAVIFGSVFYYMKGKIGSYKKALFLLGITMTVLTMISIIFIPKETFEKAFAILAIPVMVLYPMAIYVYGMLVVNAERRYEMEFELKQLNSDLEKQVALRTREVEAINSGLIEEIRVRKETELALKNAERAATSANKMKSDFLANMSHEIRTPLNAIIGYTHLIGKTELDEKQLSFIRKMDSSSTNLLNIVNDILDFSKIEAGKIDLIKGPVNIYGMINRLTDTVNYEVIKKQLYFNVYMGKKVPEWIIGDDNRINQVLLNVLSNAVKFTNEGGVTMSVDISESKNKTYIELIIEDTGIGVKEDQAKSIFDEFTQANMSINREFGGTGLGLSITKKLIDAMGGEVGFSSEYGEGSKVSIRIPFDKSHQRLRHFDENMKIILITNQSDRYRNFINQLYKMDVEISVVKTIGQLHIERYIDYVLIDGEQESAEVDKLISLVRERESHQIPIDIVSYYRDRQIQSYIEEENQSVLYLPASSTMLIKHISNKNYTNQEHTLEERSHMKRIEGKKVLIVEDNQLNQDIQRTIIEDQGGHVVIVDDGVKAVELVSNKKFDIILMDIHMPIMGGYDAAKAIRENEGDGRTPIIAMTADVQIGVEEKVKAAGMDDYIKKPIDVLEVYKVMSKWL